MDEERADALITQLVQKIADEDLERNQAVMDDLIRKSVCGLPVAALVRRDGFGKAHLEIFDLMDETEPLPSNA